MTKKRTAARGEPFGWLVALSQFADTDDCITWPYATTGAGYGALSAFGRTNQLAHRVVLTLTVGEPSETSLIALHSCGNGRLGCVNPRHLSWGTYSQNNGEDRVRQGTQISGERHHKAKLTCKTALAAYHDPRTCREIAADYGVSKVTVQHLKAGRVWSSITGHPKRLRGSPSPNAQRAQEN